jgi:MFS family permease
MISENSTQKTQATAFSIFAFSGNLGIFLGPLIGGLAKPAEQYKSIFGEVKFWHDYPYALPTLISGAFVLAAAMISMFFVKEVITLSYRR